MNYTPLDCLRLMASLESIAQQAPSGYDTATTKAIAIKRLKAILGQEDKATVLKATDLKSMDTLLAFLKAHPEAYSGTAIVSDTERPDDIPWAPYFVNGVALKAYLDHLHQTIKDPITLPLLNNLVVEVNRDLQLGYEKPQSTDKPEQASGKSPTKDHTKTGPISSESINAVLPLNNNYINLISIKQWLESYLKVALDEYKPLVAQALSTLDGITHMTNVGQAPISFSQPVDVVYTNVRDFFRGKGGQIAQHSVDMPLIYLQRLSQLIGEVMAVLDAYGSQFPMKEPEIAKQRQFAQYIQVELSSWMGQIPNVQQKLDGKR